MSIKKAVSLVAAILAVASAWPSPSPSPSPSSSPSSAVVDLTAVDLTEAVRLDASWAIYWNRFVDPAAFEVGEAPLPDAYVPMPALWTSYGPGFDSVGYATLQLSLVGLEPGRRYGLKASAFQSAASLYAGGRLVQAHGRPARTAADEEPAWRSLVSPLEADETGRLELVLHVSNFSDRSGGTHASLAFGDLAAVARERERAVAYELFMCGAILVMGAYYLGLFAFRRKERAALWFGLLCVTLAVRVLLYDEFYLVSIFPSLGFRTLFALGYLSFTAAVACVAAFVRATFPGEFPRWATIGAVAASAAYALFVIVAPTRLTSLALPAFQACALAVGLACAVAIALAVARKRPGAGLFGLGFLAIFGTAVYDIFVTAGVVHGAFASQVGMLAFLFALSLILTRRYAGAFSAAEALSDDLARVNKSMERFVPKEFLGFLKKRSLEEIELGDSSSEEMAVLFVDVRSFSRMAEDSTPEATFSFINEYLARVGPAVRDHGGFIDKYLGDGFMALFPGGAEPALRCALDVQARVAAYNLEREAQGRKPIRVGVGMHAGRLMLGTIGESRRMDGTVVSDAVNVASRLEGVSKEYGLGIAASECVLKELSDPTAFRMRFIGKVRVKGKAEPVSVFDIYEGDPDELRSRKDLTRAAFERGIEAFHEHRLGDARTLFSQVLATIPDDGAALRYLNAIGERDPA